MGAGMTRWQSALLMFAVGPGVGAVELRIVSWNVKDGVGAPGSAEAAAVLETLQRLQPDVIAFQEVSAGNTSPSNAAYFADLRAVLTAAGFQTTRAHLAIAGDAHATATYSAGEFGNSSQSLVLASRHPITRTVQIGRGLAGKKEHTRYPLFVQVDVPGTTNDPSFVVVHYKQGDTQADEFRRGIESLRTRQFLEAEGLSGATGHVFVLGDFNEEVNEPQTASFSTAGIVGGFTFGDGSSLPASFLLGGNVPATFAYDTFPYAAFQPVGLAPLPTLQTDGESDRTYNVAGNARLDYILCGTETTGAGTVQTEIYSSLRERTGDGLPKAPALPVATLSLTATDHFAVVADVVLDAVPSLTLTVPATAPLWPGRGMPDVIQATLSRPAPADEALEVTLSTFRAGPVSFPESVTLPAGSTAVPVELTVGSDGYAVAPDRRVTLVATAAGHRRALAAVPTRRFTPSGALLISQYTEPASGSAPKGIEVWNASSRDIDFTREPLRVLAYTNGSATFEREAAVEMGTLPKGAVLVIGDASCGDHLAAQGLVTTPSGGFAALANGWVVTNTAGHVVFVKDSFAFNGDDALELQLASERCDVFGTPGQDPGTAWTTAGNPVVSTEGRNLTLLPSALQPAGAWTSPGERFAVVTTGALSGFGVAPVVNDPFAVWLAERGLTGAAAQPDADPDGNGRTNLVDFDFGPASAPLVTVGTANVTLSVPARPTLGNVRWRLEESSELGSWLPVGEFVGRAEPVVTIDRPRDGQTQRYWRFVPVKP